MLPAVADAFREAYLLRYIDYRSVIQRRFAVKLPEDLVLVGRQPQKSHAVFSVDHGEQRDAQSSVVVLYLPRLEVIELTARKRDIESDIIQFVRFAVVEYGVLARSRFAETVAEVEPERRAVHRARKRRPIPSIFVRPDASSPVEHAAAVFKLVTIVAQSEPTDAAEAIHFGVVIELLALFKRYSDRYIIAGIRYELYLAGKVAFFVKVTELAAQLAFAFFDGEIYFYSALAKLDVAAFHSARHTELTHRQQSYLAFSHIPKVRKVEKRYRRERHIRIIRNRQSDCELIVAETVIVPFFYAQFFALDRGAVVRHDLRKRISALIERTRAVEKVSAGK